MFKYKEKQKRKFKHKICSIEKNHRFCFFRISRSFFFFFLVFKKKNVGSGLVLGSVGLRQYNNFFFWPYPTETQDYYIQESLQGVSWKYFDQKMKKLLL